MERIAVYGKAEDVTELSETNIYENFDNLIYKADILNQALQQINALDKETVGEIIKQQKICDDNLSKILNLFSNDLMNSLLE